MPRHISGIDWIPNWLPRFDLGLIGLLENNNASMKTWEEGLLEEPLVLDGPCTISDLTIVGGDMSSTLEAGTEPQASSRASVGVLSGLSFPGRLAGKTTPSTAHGLLFVDHVIVAGNDLSLL